MSDDRCSVCNKEFSWYWTWKYQCSDCHSWVCSNCYNTKFEPVICHNCHYCQVCKRKFNIYDLSKSRLKQYVCKNCHICQRCNMESTYDKLKYTSDKLWVCEHCHKCIKCGEIFDRNSNMNVNHRDSTRDLCPPCYADYEKRKNDFIGGTKHEFFKGKKIKHNFGLVTIDEPCDNPADVEAKIKTEVLYIGGNAYIKFFWDKHIEHHDECYVAGHGKKGNPYYRTNHYTTQYFTGHAEAVLLDL